MKTRILAVLLAAMMLIPLLASCGSKGEPVAPSSDGSSDGSTEGTLAPTEAPTETPTEAPTDAPVDPVDPPVLDPNASVYSGTPDTSWYTGDKTEYVLKTADQFVGFQELRSETFTYEGITVKLDCDVIFNPGTSEEIKAKGAGNYAWKPLHSKHLFKGTFDGQGHTISGIYMQLSSSAVKGTFGGVGGNATLKNFNLINAYFGGPSVAGKSILGAVAARVEENGANVTLSNVKVQALMEECEKPISQVGGLIGCVSGVSTVTMENCHFYGSISISGNYAGGMIGFVSNADAAVSMTSCANYASITTTRYCGGLIGQSQATKTTFTSCANYGQLHCSTDCGDLVGNHTILYDPYNGAHPAIKEGTTALRVMSFNIQGSLPKTSGILDAAALNRVEAVKQEILYYTPDLIGLQEDNWYWLNALELKDYNIIQDSNNGSSVSSERCAIYYKKGMNLLEGGTQWMTVDSTGDTTALTYADISDPNSPYYLTDTERERLQIYNDADLKRSRKTYWDENTNKFVEGTTSYPPITTRKFTYGVFEVNGQILIYVNTHLTHRSQNADYSNDELQKIRSLARVAEFNNLMERVSKIEAKYENALVFFTGDFNHGKGTPIFNLVTETYGYISAEVVSPEHIGPNGSWNNAFVLDKQGDTYPDTANKEGTTTGYLDYCFVEKGISIDRFTVGAGKSTIKAVDGSTKVIYTSDHLPIITDFHFKTATTGKPIVPDHSGDVEEDLTKPDYFDGLADTSWYTGDKKEYVLTTAEQFAGFFHIRQNGKGDITFEGVTIKLARDLIFNEGTAEEFLKGKPIELEALNSKYLFKGTFDGQGHTIQGIYMQCTSAGVKGLFGGMGDNAVIKNLTLKNCYAGSASGSGKNTLGILVSRIVGKNVLFSNVKIDGFYMKENTQSFYGIGALTGRVDAGMSLTIENCEVIGGKFDFGTLGSKIGGLVGLVQSDASLKIVNSKATNVEMNGTNECGGLVGFTFADVNIDSASSFTGTINCPGTKNDKICK